MPPKMTVTAMLTGRHLSTAVDGFEFTVMPKFAPIVRPGAEPTHDDELAGKRWHYLNLDGSKMDPDIYIFEHKPGCLCAKVRYKVYADPAGCSDFVGMTLEQVRARIDAELRDQGSEVIDPPEWWAEAQRVRDVLPDGARLAGPMGEGDPWLVCTDTPEGRAIGSWAPSPTAALREAVKTWTLHARETQRTIDTLYGILREAGYSADPAGLDEVLFQAGVRPGSAKPGAPGDIQAMTFLEPAPLGVTVTVTLPDGTRIDIGKPAR